MNKSPVYLVGKVHNLTTFENPEEARSCILKQKVKRWELRIELLEQALPTLKRKPERQSCAKSRYHLSRELEGFNKEINLLDNEQKE